MARIRTVKPEFWTHEDLSALPEATHLLAAALLNHADDEGYFKANPKLVEAACTPLREPSVSVAESLEMLAGIGWVELGTGEDGKQYGRIVTFADHQKVSHKTASKISTKTITWEALQKTPENIQSPPESLRPEQGTGNRERNREQGRERSPRGDHAPEGFDEFWEVYPRKQAKGSALKAYANAVKRAAPDEVLAGCRRYARAKANEEKKFIAHPATWLNADRWLDEEERANGGSNITPEELDRILNDPTIGGTA
jgi:hypothetical protein